MSYEVIQPVGKYRYIYLTDGYRDKDGKVKQNRRPIGKIDPKTGAKVYKPEYLQELMNQGVAIDIPSTERQFSIEDIQKSSIRSYGLFYLFRGISDKNKLIDILASSMPNYWKEYFMLACYMVATSDPLMYCSEWIKTTDSLEVGSMASQRISELLMSMKSEEMDTFYRNWYHTHENNEYLALDITSESSYSDLIEDVEWGYNRDGERLPQINLCMLIGESNRLPIYQSTYSGSQKDVKTLITTLSKFEATTGKRSVTLVMDKGFYSTGNIKYLLGNEKNVPIKFLISVPFTSAFAKKQVESEKKDIDCVENTIVINGSSLRAVTKYRVWDKDHKLFTHTFYSAKKAAGIRENLYATVAILRDKAILDPEKYLADDDYKKYLTIRKSEKNEAGYTITIKKEVVERELQLAGWVVLISNDISDAQHAMQVYRDKDVVEKGFSRLKNNIDLGRLRVHSDNAMQGKQFIGFIASILMSEINKVMEKHKLYSKYTMRELLLTVSKHRVQEINRQLILYPASKEQKLIYGAFNLDVPAMQSFVVIK